MTATPVSFARLLASAAAAAVLVAAGSLAWLHRGLPQQPPEPIRFAAPALNFMMGSGSVEDGHVLVEAYADGYALLSSGPLAVQADRYPFLQLRLEPRGHGGALSLFWRRSEAPGDLIRMPIRETGKVLVNLAGHEDWRGEIAEFGFLLREDERPAPAIGMVALEPARLNLRLQRTWTDWAAFEGWSQKSINHLQGGRPGQALRLPLLVIAWLALALLLSWLTHPRRARPFFLGGAVLFLAAWMLLDLRWSVNSVQQTGETLRDYRSASEQERLSRSMDGIVYREIARLQARVLSPRPSRILIASDADTLEYFPLRAKYHLLPHSANVVRRLPAGLKPSSLDYLVYFGPADGINSLPGWDPGWERSLRLLDRSEFIQVFEVDRNSD
jgi:hypothetical protein